MDISRMKATAPRPLPVGCGEGSAPTPPALPDRDTGALGTGKRDPGDRGRRRKSGIHGELPQAAQRGKTRREQPGEPARPLPGDSPSPWSPGRRRLPRDRPGPEGDRARRAGSGAAVPACPARRAERRPLRTTAPSMPRAPGVRPSNCAPAAEHAGSCSPRGFSEGMGGRRWKRGLPAFPALGPGRASSP